MQSMKARTRRDTELPACIVRLCATLCAPEPDPAALADLPPTMQAGMDTPPPQAPLATCQRRYPNFTPLNPCSLPLQPTRQPI